MVKFDLVGSVGLPYVIGDTVVQTIIRTELAFKELFTDVTLKYY